MRTNKKADRAGTRAGSKDFSDCAENYAAARATAQRTCGYGWRRTHGLLVISDRIRAYRATRHPRGDYRTPLPVDVMAGWRCAA